MIKKLENNITEVSEEIRRVFQVSYAVEAILLKAVDFPPLKRTLVNFITTKNDFYGYFVEDKLTAVIEIKKETSFIHIQSLVVDPIFFKQGIANKMLSFVFKKYGSNLYFVETGVDNLPAITLYKKHLFKEIKQWKTDHGILKVRFERNIA